MGLISWCSGHTCHTCLNHSLNALPTNVTQIYQIFWLKVNAKNVELVVS